MATTCFDPQHHKPLYPPLQVTFYIFIMNTICLKSLSLSKIVIQKIIRPLKCPFKKLICNVFSQRYSYYVIRRTPPPPAHCSFVLCGVLCGAVLLTRTCRCICDF